MIKILDAHLHLLDLQAGQYGWLKPENPPFWPDKSAIANNVDEADIALQSPLQLAGFVHIEAGFDNQAPWREIDWLAAHCEHSFKAVAGFELQSNTAQNLISTLLKRPQVSGVRHILDERASEILTLPQTLSNFDLLQSAALSFDVQMSLYDHHGVCALLKAAQQFPQLVFIVNHAGFPLSSSPQIQDWLDAIQTIAGCENMLIKLSGWEMHQRQWQTQRVSPLIAHIHNAFGSQRVMLGSNFPLCLWRMPYQRYWETLISLIPSECTDAYTHQNAQHWYKVECA